MGLHIGVDEVGYGPRLGPFVVAAVVFDTPRPDLWRLLSPEIGRESGARVPVCDSKVLFSQARGIRSLEPTALSFFEASSYRSFCEARGAPMASPWTQEDLPLPCDAPRARVDEAREAVERACRRAGVRILDLRLRLVEPPEFNAAIGRLGNKHDFHFETVAALVQDVLSRHRALRASLRIGKLSGRTFYLRPLSERFHAPIFIRRETRRESSYVMDLEGREVELSFIRDGDASDFSIALASIAAKYVRECWMRLFNRYWARRRADLRPTAGYGEDALRFFREIEPELEPLCLQPHEVLRSR